MAKLDPEQRRILKEQRWRTKPSLYAERMSRGAWTRYSWVEYILERIREKIIAGGARIIVNAPPRHGKSESISFWLPSWYLNLYPNRRIILASYGERLAVKWGRKVRDHLDEHPDSRVVVSKNHRSANNWATSVGGGMMSVGVGTGVTGEGFQLGIIDDPHKDWEEALSPTYRGRVLDWFNSTYYTRAEPGANIVVVQTRWQESDLSGYLMNEHEDNWDLIRLPALAEENDLLGREEGEALCPERYSAKALEQIRAAMSSYMFAGLYQQRPSPLAGGMVKRDWFQRYKCLPEELDEQIQTWDFTFTETVSGSFVVGQVWGRKDANFYLVDQVRDRLDFPGMLMAMRSFTNRHPEVIEKIVEEAANGYAVIASLKDEIPGIIGIRPKGSKVARLVAVSGLIEAGNVWIPEQSVAPWADDFIEEVVNFPNGANDDQVDAMTMGLSRLVKRTHNFKFALPTAGVRENPWQV